MTSPRAVRSRRTHSHTRGRTAAAAVALLLGASLTACGGDDDSSEPSSTDSSAAPSTASASPAGDVPTEQELAATLLTVSDLPEGFAVAIDDDAEDDQGDDPFDDTCLDDVGEFSDALGFEPDAEAEIELEAETTSGQTAAEAKVQGYADPAVLAPTFATFTDSLQSCTSVETTDEDGIDYALDITYDDSVDLPGADDQIRINVAGTISMGAESYDLTYRFVIGLLGRYLSIVGTYAIGEDATGALDATDDLAATQAERVAELG